MRSGAACSAGGVHAAGIACGHRNHRAARRHPVARAGAGAAPSSHVKLRRPAERGRGGDRHVRQRLAGTLPIGYDLHRNDASWYWFEQIAPYMRTSGPSPLTRDDYARIICSCPEWNGPIYADIGDYPPQKIASRRKSGVHVMTRDIAEKTRRASNNSLDRKYGFC